MGEWRYSSTSLDPGTRRRLVDSFSPRPSYTEEKSPRHPLDRRLSGLQSQSGGCGEDKNVYIKLKQIWREGVDRIQLAQGIVQWWLL
jgi:hypothetical protein